MSYKRVEPVLAEDWLESERIRNVQRGFMRHRWLKKSATEQLAAAEAHGSYLIPEGGLIAREPIVLPMYVSIEDPWTDQLRLRPSIYPDLKTFPAGEPLVQWVQSRRQGAFSQVAKNLWLNCRWRANGIMADGDQESYYSRIAITDPYPGNVRLKRGQTIKRGYGFWARTVSHGAIIEGIYTRGGHSGRYGKKHGGVAILLGDAGRPVHCTLTGCHSHNIETAVKAVGCFSVMDLGHATENVGVAYNLNNCRNVEIRGLHLGVNGANDDGVLFKLVRTYGFVMRGTARKQKRKKLYLESDVDGRVLLSSKGKSQTPQNIRSGELPLSEAAIEALVDERLEAVIDERIAAALEDHLGEPT